jgi:DNA-binding CsgD family transcriptional regulator
MLGFVSELAALEHPHDFRAGVLPGLRDLVPCEIATYNEVDFGAGSMIAIEDPPGSVFDGAAEIFVRLGHQNPLIPRYQRTRDGRPYKWSDLITRRELHQTDLYREAYALMRIEYQIVFCLPTPPELIIGFALNGRRRDFTERDRQLLNLVRGPMIQAYRTVQRYADLVDRLAALERGLERSGAGVVVLERSADAHVASFISEEATRLLDLHRSSGTLPSALSDWLAEIDVAEAERGFAPRPLLVQSAGDSQVVVHFVPGRPHGGPDALLVERAGEPLTISHLRAAGLTPREAEVMRLVALGGTNAQVAAELTVSPRTVQKHLENVYEKLGARSRTQAMLTAWSIGRACGWSPGR